MEQSGEAPEPEQPATQSTPPLPPPSTTDGGGADRVDSRAFLIVGILLLVGVIGVLSWLARGDDGLDAVEREQERFPAPTAAPVATPPDVPSASTTSSPTAVATPAPTVSPTAAPTATPTEPATSDSPPPVGSDPSTTTPAPDPYVAQLVPSLAAFPEHLATPEAAQMAIDAMLASGRHDVAAPGRAATICAAVPMEQPLALRGRWERDGRRIAMTDLERREAPGYGECLENDGDILAAGAYQYIAADSDGRESAAGSIVLGAALVEQAFVNDGQEPVCAMRIAPSATRYFEVYVYDAAPVAPGTTIALAVAAVEQDVETVGCGGDEVLAAFTFTPDPAAVQSLAP